MNKARIPGLSLAYIKAVKVAEHYALLVPGSSAGIAGRSFNGWNDFTEPMQWKDGAWTATIPLSKGHYKYKFVVDGVWLMDSRNPNLTKGSLDSELVLD